jgi:hypothetical protein
MQRPRRLFVLISWCGTLAVIIEVIMKTMFLTLMAILGFAIAASAASPDTVSLKRGQQKSAANGEVILKFISVIEDSRCPTDANCVWAGNAKIRVRISNRHGGSKIVVMNTTTGQLGDQYDGWAIVLTSLTPLPKAAVKTDPRRYVATFTVRRLTR